MKKIILTGGGTAGHVTPNIALIPRLKELGYEVSGLGAGDELAAVTVKRQPGESAGTYAVQASGAIVVRGGKSHLIPSDQLVLDDIVIFKTGKQICADAVVLRGEIRAGSTITVDVADGELICR